MRPDSRIGPGALRCFSAAVTPGYRPGVHVDRLKVVGDILTFPGSLPPSRSDEHGFRIKSGMTEWGRTNPGIAATRRSQADNLPHLGGSGLWPRLVLAHGLE
jgi:hypothetical protein